MGEHELCSCEPVAGGCRNPLRVPVLLVAAGVVETREAGAAVAVPGVIVAGAVAIAIASPPAAPVLAATTTAATATTAARSWSLAAVARPSAVARGAGVVMRRLWAAQSVLPRADHQRR